MAVLIHLNGPPGIGKSTLAAYYADRHPGTLVVDIDALHRFLGGWRTVAEHPHHVLEPVALAMAGAHLSGGRDVVLPQYVGRADRLDVFAGLARAHGADFVEVLLTTDRGDAVDRFARRRDESEWDVWSREVVAGLGGEEWLADAYDRLVALARRPGVRTVHSPPGDVGATYAALRQALVR